MCVGSKLKSDGLFMLKSPDGKYVKSNPVRCTVLLGQKLILPLSCVTFP